MSNAFSPVLIKYPIALTTHRSEHKFSYKSKPMFYSSFVRH